MLAVGKPVKTPGLKQYHHPVLKMLKLLYTCPKIKCSPQTVTISHFPHFPTLGRVLHPHPTICSQLRLQGQSTFCLSWESPGDPAGPIREGLSFTLLWGSGSRAQSAVSETRWTWILPKAHHLGAVWAWQWHLVYTSVSSFVKRNNNKVIGEFN